MTQNADSVPEEGGFFGTVKRCPNCLNGRNIQMGAGPPHDCETCGGSGMVIEQDAHIDSSGE